MLVLHSKIIECGEPRIMIDMHETNAELWILLLSLKKPESFHCWPISDRRLGGNDAQIYFVA